MRKKKENCGAKKCKTKIMEQRILRLSSVKCVWFMSRLGNVTSLSSSQQLLIGFDFYFITEVYMS